MVTIKTLLSFSVLAGFVLAIAPAQASSILYQPQNPAIFPNANPGGAAALLASVDRPADPNAVGAGGFGLTPAQIVQQSVLGQISAQINDQIFNGGQASGSFDLGGGNLISYVRVGGNLVITVIDPISGSTVISLPDL